MTAPTWNVIRGNIETALIVLAIPALFSVAVDVKAIKQKVGDMDHRIERLEDKWDDHLSLHAEKNGPGNG